MTDADEDADMSLGHVLKLWTIFPGKFFNKILAKNLNGNWEHKQAILRSLQENYANNDRYMNNNVDILSSAAGAQVRAGHDDDLEGFIGFEILDFELLTILSKVLALGRS